MNDNLKISGTWNGELIYGEEYGPKIHNNKLFFRLVLEENDGDITGECIDVSGTGVVNEPATINGFIEDDMISFVKQYPACYILNKEGSVETIPEKEPLEMNYSGFYNNENQSFEGDWHMIIEIKQLTFGYAEHAVSGTWSMKKAD